MRPPGLTQFWGFLHIIVTVFAVVPGYVKPVNVRDGTGSVKLYGASLEEIEVQTSAGEIRLVNVSANTANVTNGAGDISITGGGFAALDLTAEAGGVKVSDASVGSLGVIDNAGSVKVSQVNVSDAVIEDNAGDIGMSNVLGDVNASAKACNIEVFLGVKYNVVYYLTTDACDIDINLLPSLHVAVTLPGVMASPPVIYAEAKGGSVKVNYV